MIEWKVLRIKLGGCEWLMESDEDESDFWGPGLLSRAASGSVPHVFCIKTIKGWVPPCGISPPCCKEPSNESVTDWRGCNGYMRGWRESRHTNTNAGLHEDINLSFPSIVLVSQAEPQPQTLNVLDWYENIRTFFALYFSWFSYIWLRYSLYNRYINKTLLLQVWQSFHTTVQ